MPLVNTLKYLRLKQKWSCDFVAVQTNLCARSLWYFEVGAISISYDSAERLSKLFAIEIGDLIGKNRKIFISDEEHLLLFPQICLDPATDPSIIKFLQRPIKKSLKDVHTTVFAKLKEVPK